MKLPESIEQQMDGLKIEQISDILVAPQKSGIYYDFFDGQYYIRSHGTNFNLLHRGHIKILQREGLNGVYSLGNGLNQGNDVDLCLVQIFSEIDLCRTGIIRVLNSLDFSFLSALKTDKHDRQNFYCSILI